VKHFFVSFIGGFATVSALWLSFDPGSAMLVATDLVTYWQRAQETVAVVAMGSAVALGVCAVMVRKGLVGW
jgi:hypothetical protein